MPVDAVLVGASVLDGLFVGGDIFLELGDLAVGEEWAAGVIGEVTIEAAACASRATDGITDELSEELLAGFGGVRASFIEVLLGVVIGGGRPINDMDVAILGGGVKERVVGVVVGGVGAGGVEVGDEEDVVIGADNFEEGVDLVLGERGVVGA